MEKTETPLDRYMDNNSSECACYRPRIEIDNRFHRVKKERTFTPIDLYRSSYARKDFGPVIRERNQSEQSNNGRDNLVEASKKFGGDERYGLLLLVARTGDPLARGMLKSLEEFAENFGDKAGKVALDESEILIQRLYKSIVLNNIPIPEDYDSLLRRKPFAEFREYDIVPRGQRRSSRSWMIESEEESIGTVETASKKVVKERNVRLFIKPEKKKGIFNLFSKSA